MTILTLLPPKTSIAARHSPRRIRREPVEVARSPRTRRPDLSIIVPVYNEAESLPTLHAELTAALADRSYEIIFIDDGSRDGSVEILREIHRSDRRVKVVRLRRNFGKTAALAAGFRLARGEIYVTIDADLQDDPAEIPKLIDELSKGHDLVTAWRQQRYDRVTKRLASWGFNRLSCWISGLSLHDMNCGLKVFRRAVADDLNLYGEMHRFIPVLAHGKGFRVGELPVHHRPRRHGLSKYGTSRILFGSLDLLKVFFLTRYVTRPLRLFGTAGFLMLIVGIILSLHLTWLRFSGETIGNRPLLWLAAGLVLAGIQIVSVGLIAELIRHLANRPGQEYAVAETLR